MDWASQGSSCSTVHRCPLRLHSIFYFSVKKLKNDPNKSNNFQNKIYSKLFKADLQCLIIVWAITHDTSQFYVKHFVWMILDNRQDLMSTPDPDGCLDVMHGVSSWKYTSVQLNIYLLTYCNVYYETRMGLTWSVSILAEIHTHSIIFYLL